MAAQVNLTEQERLDRARANSRERQKRYRERHPDRVREQWQKYYNANHEELCSKHVQWKKKNAERVREYDRAYYAKNPENKKACSRLWFYNNPDLAKKQARKYYEENKHAFILRARERRGVCKKQTPDWANMDHIKDIYKRCVEVTNRTMVEHHVDHIVPLRGETVCGLHVENNLQIIPAWLNRSKGNSFNDNNNND